VRCSPLNSAPTWRRPGVWRSSERKFAPPGPTGVAHSKLRRSFTDGSTLELTRACRRPKQTLRPAPDVDRLTGNEAGFVATEEGDHTRDVLRLPDPAQRDLRRRA